LLVEFAPASPSFGKPAETRHHHRGHGGRRELKRKSRDLPVLQKFTDPGEGIGRWASNGTQGSEFTGLYFDPTDKRRAWVNIQHPDSDNDRTIEITIPKHVD
jgi:secreted PhoX family phosphatase